MGSFPKNRHVNLAIIKVYWELYFFPQIRLDFKTFEKYETFMTRVTSNWENPRRGTSDLVEEVLSNVLDACAKSCVEDYEELLKNLWNSNLNDVSWLSKYVYLVQKMYDNLLCELC